MDEVPIFVKLAGTSMIESTKQDATSALYDIISGVQLEGERYVAIEGAQVYCYGVYFKALDVTALYVHTDVDIKNAYSPVVMRVARWQYGPSLMPYGLVNTNEVLQHAFWITSKSRRMKPSLASVRFIENIFSGVVDLPVLKVSASHLRHITVKELTAIDFKTIISKAGFMFNVIKDLHQKGDMHEAFFVGLILWACTMPDTIYKWISSSSVWMWTFNGIDDFVKIIKEKLTLRMKALQNLVPIDLTPMFEMEVLVNRGVGEVDWEKEKRHRVQPNVANFERDEIMKEAIVLFKRAIATGQKPKRLKWENFWSASYCE
uniref:RNA-directed RNA polymerase n=1 Tax=Uromyces fabae virus TaxID=3069272 RepID=A0AA51YGE4_9VIRU|nr:RNA-dependent RNA polymerase [Uromyces fabae virus]